MPRNVTYAQQFIKLIKHLCIYITKHSSALNSLFTDPLEIAAFAALEAACGAFLSNEDKYQP